MLGDLSDIADLVVETAVGSPDDTVTGNVMPEIS